MLPASRSESGDRIADPRISLVTGFPGFSARELVRFLLESGGEEVWAVVRAEHRERAVAYRSGLTSARAARLLLLEGDPAAIDLGLSGSEYRRVLEHARRIFHFSHRVEPGLSRERYEADNVGGMREALEVAQAARSLSSLVVHSSVAVSGDRVGSVAENDLAMQQRFLSPAEETLARAELMARRRMPRLPIVVLRTGQVTGDRQTGQVDSLDGVYLLILLILSSPQDLSSILPRWGDAPIHAFPVDALARAAVQFSELHSAFGATLHLTDDPPMTIRMAFNRAMKTRRKLLDEGFALPSVARLLGKDGLIRGPLRSILSRPRAFVNSTFRDVRYDTTVARKLCERADLNPPRLEGYFDRLVRHVASAATVSPHLESGS